MEGVSKRYVSPGRTTAVLEGVDLRLEAGASMAIVGPSGCGKSTLLNIAGALDRPTEGSVRFEGGDISGLGEADLARFRNASVGFVFQMHHLLPQCNVLENVLIPTLVNPQADGARDRAAKLLDRVGLGHRLDHKPGLLSGGECQRVAVVRALINRPRLLLADEPTGSLSQSGALELTELLLELNQEESLGLLVVTHAQAVAQRVGNVHELHEGRLVACA
jgi:ABC-type lipoprotein export system ATPase subunit